MASFTVSVRFTQEVKKDLTIRARDEEHACEIAESIVQKWDGVLDIIEVEAQED